VGWRNDEDLAGPLTLSSSDQDAEFSDYVGANAEKVRFSAYLLCADWHEAEDIAQIAFIRLYQSWRRIDRSEPIDAYVKRTLVRVFLNNRRRLWRKIERLASAPPEPLPEAAAAPEERMVIWAALSQVPRRQRAALVLRYWEDLSLAETAVILGCSIGNVKSQCARGLRTLRRVLEVHDIAALRADVRRADAGPVSRQPEHEHAIEARMVADPRKGGSR
jgi:RNA polymerase sigma-70 factor (sigma-E family)